MTVLPYGKSLSRVIRFDNRNWIVQLDGHGGMSFREKGRRTRYGLSLHYALAVAQRLAAESIVMERQRRRQLARHAGGKPTGRRRSLARR